MLLYLFTTVFVSSSFVHCLVMALFKTGFKSLFTKSTLPSIGTSLSSIAREALSMAVRIFSLLILSSFFPIPSVEAYFAKRYASISGITHSLIKFPVTVPNTVPRVSSSSILSMEISFPLSCVSFIVSHTAVMSPFG